MTKRQCDHEKPGGDDAGMRAMSDRREDASDDVGVCSDRDCAKERMRVRAFML